MHTLRKRSSASVLAAGLWLMSLCPTTWAARSVDSDASPVSEPASKAEPFPEADGLAAPDTATLRRLVGLSPEDWAMLEANPQAATETARLLHGVVRMPGFLLEPAFDPLQPTTAVPLQGQPFEVTGVLTALRSQAVPEPLRAGLGFERWYEATIQLTPEVTVQATIAEVPRPWEAAGPQGERVSATGLLTRAPRQPGEAWHLVGQRLAWTPAGEAADGLKLSCYAHLAAAGMDVGRLLDVQDHTALDATDGQALYALLRATRQASWRPTPSTLPRLSIADVLVDPPQHRGRFFLLEGIARRIVQIAITDPQVRRATGLDAYYEINMFVDLPQPIHYRMPGADTTAFEFRATYPVAVCVARLPEGLAASEDLRQKLRVPAIFLKIWAHESDLADAATVSQGRALQPTPLCVGWTPRRVIAAPTGEGDWIPGGILFAIGLTVCLIAVWNHLDRLQTRRTKRR